MRISFPPLVVTPQTFSNRVLLVGFVSFVWCVRADNLRVLLFFAVCCVAVLILVMLCLCARPLFFRWELGSG